MIKAILPTFDLEVEKAVKGEIANFGSYEVDGAKEPIRKAFSFFLKGTYEFALLSASVEIFDTSMLFEGSICDGLVNRIRNGATIELRNAAYQTIFNNSSIRFFEAISPFPNAEVCIEIDERPLSDLQADASQGDLSAAVGMTFRLLNDAARLSQFQDIFAQHRIELLNLLLANVGVRESMIPLALIIPLQFAFRNSP